MSNVEICHLSQMSKMKRFNDQAKQMILNVLYYVDRNQDVLEFKKERKTELAAERKICLLECHFVSATETICDQNFTCKSFIPSSGVPQGLNLSMLLFLLFINDLADDDVIPYRN